MNNLEKNYKATQKTRTEFLADLGCKLKKSGHTRAELNEYVAKKTKSATNTIANQINVLKPANDVDLMELIKQFFEEG